jgi:hypothetical protein
MEEALVKQRSWKKIVLWIVVGGIAAFGLIQLVPYGHATANPPVVKEPNWDSPQTRKLAKKACFDCHSNETKRWWATKIAPFSWLAAADVNGARDKLNFSDWRGGGDWEELQQSISSGSMPPLQYTIAHPNAKLSDTEKQQLIDGLQATIQQTP